MRIEPYLFFEGRCDEALEFYRSALGAELTMLMRYRESPEPELAPPELADKVMHASLRVGDVNLMLSDGSCQGAPGFRGFALSLDAVDEAQAKRLFAALAEGGEVQMPLAKTFWSPCFGMVADRFGVSWMIGVSA
jgi:PhnB protein